MPNKIEEFLNDRIGLDEIRAIAAHKQVPVHKHSFWYYWGGITLISFVVQIVTGILLLVYYRPGKDAYESVRDITFHENFGWLIRSAHSWSASIFLFAALTHMFSVFFMKAYRAPREIGWWSGLILLGIGMVFGFSGYLLPYDDLSFFATKVGLTMVQNTPVIGTWLANLARGGLDVSDITVQRFFALHAVVLPLVFLPILGLHLYMVQRHGNAVPPSEESKPAEARMSIPFFPNFLVKDLAMWLITLNVIAILASLFPWQLGEMANPLMPAPPGIHPEWYFMGMFQMLKAIGKIVPGTAGEMFGMGLFTVGGVMWALIPLYDIKSADGRRARQATYFGLVVLLGLIVMTIWAYAAL
jgi:cytochrome b6